MRCQDDYGSSLDPSSYSNVEQFAPEHLSFYLEVDFDQSSIIGTITHTLTSLDGNSSTVWMDVWDGLTVETAEFWATNETEGCPSNWTNASFEVTTPNPNIGNALAINLPCTLPTGTEFNLRFNYVTNPDNCAMSWLTPAQTAGKVLPYMYSLCQMNFCRDFAPMMDTPSQKITYDATVVAPNEFVVRMSANTTSIQEYNSTHTIATFDAAIKIPSYLIAIVVGDLEERSLGGSNRVSVISEPAYMDAAVEEFSELPEILDIVEAYLIPYVWGNYSIVIMPPSFPWGGMEHPLVTFASHTLLTGDKSKVDTAIHELTHSYFGNDVGCQNWNNFWINEGLNTFMERKALSLLRSEDSALIEYSNGNITVYEDMLDYGLNDTYSSLFPDIQDDDPENSFSNLPYEKGSQFVYYMETLIGEDAMQAMLQLYLTNFSQQAITHRDFQAFYQDFVYANFDNATAADIIVQTDWDTWVLVPGLPPVTLNFTTAQLTEAQLLAEEYLTLGGESSPTNYTDYFRFIASQRVAFVQTLGEAGEATTAEMMAYIDNDLNITYATNPDVKTEWYILGIEKGYDNVIEPCRQWMGEQGRNAYVRPTFQALVAAGKCDTAQAWFEDYIDFYNSYVVGNMQRALEECDTNNTSTDDGGSNTTIGSNTTNGGSNATGTSRASTMFGSYLSMLMAALVVFVYLFGF